MKIRLLALLSIFLLVNLAQGEEKEALKDPQEKTSYVIGVDIGRALKNQGVVIDPDLVARGIKDGLAGGKTLITDQEIQAIRSSFQKEMMAKQQESLKQMGEKNKKEGEAFLADNKKKEGVVTLPSGLQYKIMKPGSGKKPKAEDTVVAHYRGTLVDGTEFDSSYRRNQAATFPVKGVIRGWTEALQLMDEGAKWMLFIPSDLAYGERGTRGIGPGATLIFEVELISVQEKK